MGCLGCLQYNYTVPTRGRFPWRYLGTERGGGGGGEEVGEVQPYRGEYCTVLVIRTYRVWKYMNVIRTLVYGLSAVDLGLPLLTHTVRKYPAGCRIRWGPGVQYI